MAPISRTIAWAALAAMVSARPFNNGQQPAREMVTETEWVTVAVPVTLWVDENGTPLSTVAQGGNFAAVPTTFSTSVAPVVTSTAASVSSVVPTVTSTTTLVSQSPMAPVQTPSPSTTLVPTTSSVPSTTSYVPPTTTTVSQVQRQVSSTTSVAAVASSSSAPAAAAGGSTGDTGAISASSTNSCVGTGAACEGDITYYEGGLGACGWNVNTASDMQIALPYEFMGEQSNGNKYCGQPLTIRNPTTGQTISATVGDKCMGCTGRSIDLTDALFKAIGGGCDGRCSGFQWWF